MSQLARSRHHSVRCAAFTRPELIVITTLAAILVVLMTIALMHKRHDQQRRACFNNLKNIGLAFRISSTDSSDDFPFQHSVEIGGTRELTNLWQHFLAISNEISTPNILICPTSRKKPAAGWQPFADQNISYFLGITAAETSPQSFLSGDTGFLIDGQPPQSNPISLSTNANFTYPKSIHRSTPNICMADGSVQQLNPDRLKKALRNSDVATNTLLLPRP
jgi:hypothetical protein